MVKKSCLESLVSYQIPDFYKLCLLDNMQLLSDTCHEKTDFKVFVVLMPKEGWVRPRVPILLLG